MAGTPGERSRRRTALATYCRSCLIESDWDMGASWAGVLDGRVLCDPELSSRLSETGGAQCRLRYHFAAFGPIAQWLERGTHNPSVPGSSPGGPTNSNSLATRSSTIGQRSCSPQ